LLFWIVLRFSLPDRIPAKPYMTLPILHKSLKLAKVRAASNQQL